MHTYRLIKKVVAGGRPHTYVEEIRAESDEDAVSRTEVIVKREGLKRYELCEHRSILLGKEPGD